MTAGRGGERGLSMIEAIVIATITALLSLLILPLLPRASSGSLMVAARGVDALEQLRAEREFRTLVRAVAQREVDGEPQTVVEGDARAVTLLPNLGEAAACAGAGAPVVRLAIESNALFCLSDGRRRSLMRWSDEYAAALAYSANGASWASNWTSAAAAPYVRFELRQAGRVRLAWVERVSGEPR